MAQSKARKARKPRNAPSKKARQDPNGVVVAVTPANDGTERMDFQTLGETRAREIPTLLRQAALVAEKQLGCTG